MQALLLGINSKLPLIARWRSAARTATCTSTSSTPLATAAPEIRLQQVRQRVHVAELAILHAEQMSIGRSAAAGRVSGAEGAEHND